MRLYRIGWAGALAFWLITAAGCSGGAVVFAPTPAPADASPLPYTHPSGAFSIDVPRQWSVFEQYTTHLASTSFAPPGADTPLLSVTTANLGAPADAAAFGELITRYQTQVRPDIETYSEQDRVALGDGSWRITGLRQSAAGTTEQINSFLQVDGDQFTVAEVIVPDDAALRTALEAAVNSLRVAGESPLEPTDLTALAFARPASLNLLHVKKWANADGVFFITGEVANTGAETVTDIPIAADLLTADGRVAAGAVDTPMGLGLPPGAFAPFSLRFGAGQPADAVGFRLRLGGPDWQPGAGITPLGAEALSWADESGFDEQGRLTISGAVQNTSADAVTNVRATATVFNAAQEVVGAAWVDVAPALAAGESAEYRITLPDLGGEPVNYIVSLQALPPQRSAADRAPGL